MNIMKKYLKLFFLRRKWRKKNKHNFTIADSLFPINKVTVGDGTYGRLHIKTYNNDNENLSIGKYCSLGDCIFMLGGEHDYSCISTYPWTKYLKGKLDVVPSKGPIVIEDDVWIGDNCLILSGVTIGKGAVIAANTVVSKNVPSYSIFAGNPGRVIKYRFTDDVIKKLMKIDYSQICINEHNESLLFSSITSNNVDEILLSLFRE